MINSERLSETITNTIVSKLNKFEDEWITNNIQRKLGYIPTNFNTTDWSISVRNNVNGNYTKSLFYRSELLSIISIKYIFGDQEFQIEYRIENADDGFVSTGKL